jgi:hypothetical protein
MDFVKAKANDYNDRYNGLKPFPEFSGEETWVDRIRTWEEFVEGGHMTADFLEGLFKSWVRSKGEEEGANIYDKKFRQLCPGLHDLLMEYFEKELPWTASKRKSPG